MCRYSTAAASRHYLHGHYHCLLPHVPKTSALEAVGSPIAITWASLLSVGPHARAGQDRITVCMPVFSLRSNVLPPFTGGAHPCHRWVCMHVEPNMHGCCCMIMIPYQMRSN